MSSKVKNCCENHPNNLSTAIENRRDNDTTIMIQNNNSSNNIISNKYELVPNNNIGEEEKKAMIDVINSGRITYGPIVEEFQEQFSQYVHSKYSVMVNSGSSALLLALSATLNPTRFTDNGKKDTVVFVSSVCWNTSVSPIIQLNCKPIYIDVDRNTANVSYDDFEAKVEKYKPKVFIAVHVLGNFSNEWGKIVNLCKKENIILIEDACEAMGSTYMDGRHAGTFGDFGCFSLFYSHTITSGEGGIVTCKTLQDFDLLKMLRGHGWTRDISEANQLEIIKSNPNIDARFLFANVGYNMRPLSIQAALASVQLEKLDNFIDYRISIYNKLSEKIKEFSTIFTTLQTSKSEDDYENFECRIAWHGFPIVLYERYHHRTEDFKTHLTSNNVENRPIISGNMARQPFNKLFQNQMHSETILPGADYIHDGGIFIGIHNFEMTDQMLDLFINACKTFDWALCTDV